VTLISGTPIASFDLGAVDPDFERAELRFEELSPPAASFELRIFLDQPGAGAKTPTAGNPRYIGSQFFYGLGAEAERNAPEDKLRGAGQFAPTQIRLNVTSELRRFLAQANRRTVTVTPVAVDLQGNEIRDPGLRFEAVSLVTS
jgi:hypothetical protein